jgi:hypothetical protein
MGAKIVLTKQQIKKLQPIFDQCANALDKDRPAVVMAQMWPDGKVHAMCLTDSNAISVVAAKAGKLSADRHLAKSILTDWKSGTKRNDHKR